ncbi:hypothetical protein DTL42_21510 [Bremerella cremea]|uniref:Uncharacterized protein n=1 Tax=Bremerella cremea TaxID=1031537 RepID=A0A368KKD9_9BACT|nr:hypothetical protein [Bremerella cremea]RCS41154.1 hypothetical protein DTL42_21510 [Bremerella cremea]
MGFLKRFFKSVFHENELARIGNSFEHLSEEQLEAHLDVGSYNGFELTEAVRPSFDLKVVPTQGFRREVYRDEQTGSSVPVLMASATRSNLFETFIELLDPLGNEVDVVLESSHYQQSPSHCDMYREHIDLPVLKSILYDYEDMLLNDGCTGIAVLNPHLPMEVQFDEHKLLIVYGTDLKPFENVMIDRDIYPTPEMRFITEAEHVHSSHQRYQQQLDELRMRLGMDEHYG